MPNDEIKIIPFWVEIPTAAIAEWAWWVLTLGEKQSALRVRIWSI
jgi:hypothetical protein